MSKLKQNQRRHNRLKRLPKTPTGNIELLLIQSVENLGTSGDVVTVRPGFARNYLIPHGLATIASDHHKRMVEKHRARIREIEKTRLSELRSLANELGKISVTIEANANDEGHLYGSVGAKEIVAALKQHDYTITGDQVRLEGPLRELGLYTVKIRIANEVEGELKVWVVPATGEAKTEAEA